MEKKSKKRWKFKKEMDTKIHFMVKNFNEWKSEIKDLRGDQY
jgi:hypothetical protein